MQFAEQWPLLPGYHAAVDGMSVLFILLSALPPLLLVLYIIGRQLDDTAKLFTVILATSSVLMTLFTTLHERLVSLLLILVLVMVGFYSEPWLELIDIPLNALHELYNPHE